MKLDASKLTSIQVDNIKMYDYPDFVDAYISYAELDGKPLTESELDVLNEDSSFVHQQVFAKLY